jgi:periplasmic copper chaperone A
MSSSATALSRPLARAAVLVLAVLTALVGLASAASAHVTVSSSDASPGGYGKLTFRVPNESDTASTVALRIQIPEEAAMGSLRVQPMPGWTATLTTLDLEEPIEVHGQEISSYVSVVEFRAEDGGGIRPGEFQEFALSGGPFPDADEVAYPTVQTYSDGTEAAWIEPSVDGQEPERPAPTLTLTGAAGGHGDATDVDTASDASDASAAEDDGSATAALWLSIVALVVAVAGVALGFLGRRRTVSE